MKKLFLTLVLGLICAVGFSQFTMEDGTYIYTNEFTTENARSKVVKLLNTFNATTQSAKIKTNTDEMVVATVVMNTKASYNPFAGAFVENFQMDVTFTFDGATLQFALKTFIPFSFIAGTAQKKK